MILRMAVPSPLRRLFDYLPAPDTPEHLWRPGVRALVPFGRRRIIAVVMAISDRSEVANARLRPALRLMDPEPALDTHLLHLLQWAADYYHHPIGEVVQAALPALLRREPAQRAAGAWRLTEAGARVDVDALTARAPRQAAVLARMQQAGAPLGGGDLHDLSGDWRAALRALRAKDWVEPCATQAPATTAEPAAASATSPSLSAAQAQAINRIRAQLEGFAALLVYGVTGSGKTEVYLQAAKSVLEHDRQVLIVVPEIGLTPQLIRRFRARLPTRVEVMHSGLNDRQRMTAWDAARRGEAGVIVGTRSAVFTPLLKPGLLVVDEEHDPSLKQQDGFRYSARDLAVIRARALKVPVVLASATPSLESMHNAAEGRYERLDLPQRAGAARPPDVQILDVRGRPLHAGLSDPLLARMQEHLQRGGQVMVFLNRRGYAPTLMCHGCGYVADCPRCDAHMTLHMGRQRLRCHHCGAQQTLPPVCPDCGADQLQPLGQGTERLESELQQRFADQPLVRIDRDSTRAKGAMDRLLEQARSGEARLLLGTQMLAKGHHFPEVSLVAVVDADQGLFSVDFRGAERMAQLIMQVAGRAGRARRAGEVVLQTHHPEHKLLQLLLRQDYEHFAEAALAERRDALLPPFSHLALLRAEAKDREPPQAFLEAALAQAQAPVDVEWFGPVPAPMERRQGSYRYQLLLQANRRPALHQWMDAWLDRVGRQPQARKVRWSLDIDPQDLS